MGTIMDVLDLIIKVCTFAGLVVAAMLWVVKRLEKGQAELKYHHSEDNKLLSDKIERTLKRITKKLKKKVSKAECKRLRSMCPNCVRGDSK